MIHLTGCNRRGLIELMAACDDALRFNPTSQGWVMTSNICGSVEERSARNMKVLMSYGLVEGRRNDSHQWKWRILQAGRDMIGPDVLGKHVSRGRERTGRIDGPEALTRIIVGAKRFEIGQSCLEVLDEETVQGKIIDIELPDKIVIRWALGESSVTDTYRPRELTWKYDAWNAQIL